MAEKSTNYIVRLQRANDDLNATLEKLRASLFDEVNEFLNHLSSSKFHHDPTIQVRDVQNRLIQIRSLSL